MNHPPKIFVNGKIVFATETAILPTDRGFTLGDGIFETMLALDGTVIRLEAHLSRLADGAQTLRLPLDVAVVRAAISQTLAANGLTTGAATIRLTLTRGASARGLALPAQPQPTLVVSARRHEPYPAELYRRGMRAIILPHRKNEFSAIGGIKSLNYLENILGKAEASDAGANEGIFLNTRGFLAEGCVSNLFWVRNGALFTPATDCGLVAGIVRQTVLSLGSTAGFDILEGKYNASSLFSSDEAFLTNTLMGIMPLTRVDGQPIGNGFPGEITRFLAERLTPQMPIRRRA